MKKLFLGLALASSVVGMVNASTYTVSEEVSKGKAVARPQRKTGASVLIENDNGVLTETSRGKAVAKPQQANLNGFFAESSVDEMFTNTGNNVVTSKRTMGNAVAKPQQANKINEFFASNNHRMVSKGTAHEATTPAEALALINQDIYYLLSVNSTIQNSTLASIIGGLTVHINVLRDAFNEKRLPVRESLGF